MRCSKEATRSRTVRSRTGCASASHSNASAKERGPCCIARLVRRVATGARKELPPGLKELFKEVRKHTELPVAAGFGISRPEHMKTLRGVVDAAAVGSAVVAEIDAGKDPTRLVKELLKACR